MEQSYSQEHHPYGMFVSQETRGEEQKVIFFFNFFVFGKYEGIITFPCKEKIWGKIKWFLSKIKETNFFSYYL